MNQTMKWILALLCGLGLSGTSAIADGRSGGDQYMEPGPDGPIVGVILGPTDDRFPTTDKCVGRLQVTQQISGASLYKDCTGWLVSNGAILSAGHCFTSSSSTLTVSELQFEVPYSNPCPGSYSCETAITNNLTMNYPSSANRYSFLSASLKTGMSSDWALFTVSPSSGKMPIDNQQCFYRMTQRMPSASSTVAVTGYGVSGSSPDFGYQSPDNYPVTADQDKWTPLLSKTENS